MSPPVALLAAAPLAAAPLAAAPLAAASQLSAGPLMADILGLTTPMFLGLCAVAAFFVFAIGRKRASSADSGLKGLMGGLSKTRKKLTLALRKALGQELSDQSIDELETAMLEADLGVETTAVLIEDLKKAYRDKTARTPEELLTRVRDDLKARLGEKGNDLNEAASGPTVILVVGVNGAGKTTSIAKLTKLLKDRGKRVLLCAADTFRAAAVEQLTIWAERTGVQIVKGATGADPAAVAHDAVESALAKNVDYLIVDTAGRLHTQKNLMNELGKIKRILKRKIPSAPHEVILVLDGTVGQNAIQQAKTFQAVTDVTGLFLTKLDGTAKGGVVIAIHKELAIPVKFVGIGEQMEDIQPFSAPRFVDALF